MPADVASDILGAISIIYQFAGGSIELPMTCWIYPVALALLQFACHYLCVAACLATTTRRNIRTKEGGAASNLLMAVAETASKTEYAYSPLKLLVIASNAGFVLLVGFVMRNATLAPPILNQQSSFMYDEKVVPKVDKWTKQQAIEGTEVVIEGTASLGFICTDGQSEEEVALREQAKSMTEHLFTTYCDTHKISAEERAALKLAISKSEVIALPGSEEDLFVEAYLLQSMFYLTIVGCWCYCTFFWCSPNSCF